jgi:hypothetical protein
MNPSPDTPALEAAMTYYGHDNGQGDPLPYIPGPTSERRFYTLMAKLGLRERNAREARRPARNLSQIVADAMAALSRIGGAK